MERAPPCHFANVFRCTGRTKLTNTQCDDLLLLLSDARKPGTDSLHVRRNRVVYPKSLDSGISDVCFLGLLLPDGGRPSKESRRLFPVLGLVIPERSCRSDIVTESVAMSGMRLSHRPAQALCTEQFVQASFQKCLAAPWITINET